MDREIFASTVLPPVPVRWEDGMSPGQGYTNSGCQIAVTNKLCTVASCSSTYNFEIYVRLLENMCTFASEQILSTWRPKFSMPQSTIS
jgi:hypothetical protein